MVEGPDGVRRPVRFECATIGSVDVRIGPSRVGSVRHRQVGLQGDFGFETLW